MSILKSYFNYLYKSAEKYNLENIKDALEKYGPHRRLLDIGCWDGRNTLIWTKSAKAQEIYGIEPVRHVVPLAEKRGIKVCSVLADKDLWPIKENSIDCIISNLVIEHLSNVDHFLKEASRVLVKGGIIVTSTNNLSSWHNLGAILLGWAPFDLANSSQKTWCMGNPLSVHKGETEKRGGTWTHKCVYTAHWLIAWFSLYGLRHIETYGSGYYPLPTFLGNVDKTHSAFITLVMQKV